MILPVYLYGHPVLRKMAQPITKEYPKLQELIANMWETMYHSEGVGLAAPQVGLSIKLAVIDGSPVAEAYPECENSKMVMINPELEVIEDMDAISRDEGCLSLPGVSETVKRTEHIRLRWMDENFEEHEQEFTGFLSRIIQHEYDHIEGKVFTDHLVPLRRNLIKNKLQKMARGSYRAAYKTKR